MLNNKNECTESTVTQDTSCCEKYSTPSVDIYKTDTSLVATIDMPGVAKGDVNIEIDENNVLSVKARQSFTEPENSVLTEFTRGSYYRAFTLGDEYNRDAVSATLENGVLEITIARKEEQKPRKIEISA